MIAIIKIDFEETKKICDRFSSELNESQQNILKEVFRVIEEKINECINNQPQINNKERKISMRANKQAGWNYDIIQDDPEFENAAKTCTDLARTLGYGNVIMGMPYVYSSGDLKAYGFSLLYRLLYKKLGECYCPHSFFATISDCLRTYLMKMLPMIK